MNGTVQKLHSQYQGMICSSAIVSPLVGLINAPSVFQGLMAVVLEGLSNFCAAYLDDILIFSATAEEHMAHVRQVFARLRQHRLKLK